MPRFLLLLSVFGSLGLLGCHAARVPAEATPVAASVATTLIIFYDGEAVPEALEKAIAQMGATVRYRYTTLHGLAVVVPPGKSVQEALRYFRAVPGVLSVSPDGIQHLDQGH